MAWEGRRVVLTLQPGLGLQRKGKLTESLEPENKRKQRARILLKSEPQPCEWLHQLADSSDTGCSGHRRIPPATLGSSQ